MPVADLERYGSEFGPGQRWRILVGRYDYSRYLDAIGLSMVPPLSKANFHLLEQYGYLRLAE